MIQSRRAKPGPHLIAAPPMRFDETFERMITEFRPQHLESATAWRLAWTQEKDGGS